MANSGSLHGRQRGRRPMSSPFTRKADDDPQLGDLRSFLVQTSPSPTGWNRSGLLQNARNPLPTPTPQLARCYRRTDTWCGVKWILSCSMRNAPRSHFLLHDVSRRRSDSHGCRVRFSLGVNLLHSIANGVF
jgi:hypothetical protein